MTLCLKQATARSDDNIMDIDSTAHLAGAYWNDQQRLRGNTIEGSYQPEPIRLCEPSGCTVVASLKELHMVNVMVENSLQPARFHGNALWFLFLNPRTPESNF